MVKCGVLFEVLAKFLNTIIRENRRHPQQGVIFNSSILPPVVDAADLILFQIIDKTIRNSKFRCLSEATPNTIMSSLSHYSYQKDERA
jgi:hypothetical protein